MINLKKWLYRVFIFILIGISIVCIFSSSKVTEFLIKINIFNWNAANFLDKEIGLTEKELEVIGASRDFKDICSYNNEFLMVGNTHKNLWFYSLTGMIPILDYQSNGGASQLYYTNVSFEFWSENLNDRKCLIYFYENNIDKFEYDKNSFDVLYSNGDGIIFMRK